MQVDTSQGANGVNGGYGRANQPVAYRGAPVLHRTVTAADKLAVPTAVTAADVATGGALLAATTYNCTLAAGNLLGSTTVPAVGAVLTASDASNTHVARVTTVQVPNALHYDLFLSAAAAPLWVARVTEAQRAAGCTVTAVGTVTATSPGANKIDIQVVGTGVASTAVPFSTNNAYTPELVTPVVGSAGANFVIITIFMNVTDLRSAPSFNWLIFMRNETAPTRWTPDLVPSQPTAPLSAIRLPLSIQTRQNLLGPEAIAILVDSIAGQGASLDIYTQLV